MLTLHQKRPFARKITFPMAVIPFLNAVQDVVHVNIWNDFAKALEKPPQQGITGTLYVHVPFCKSLCTHCTYDRVIYSPEEERSYLARLLQEIELYADKQLIQGVEFIAVHLGGGTPNVLSEEAVRSIMTAIKSRFHLKRDAVVNAEIGTKAYSRENIALWKELGCTRLSFGVQSFDEEVRKRCALTTSKDSLYGIAEDLRQFGFDVNFDLMYGLPGQDMAVWEKDLEQAVALNPGSLDIYCYYPLHSKLYTLCQRGKIALPDEASVLRMIETSIAYLHEKGYIQETAEDFAKPGKFCIMKDFGYGKNEISDDYVHLALGPNAMGVIRNYIYRNKFYTFPRVRNYLSSSKTGGAWPIFLLKHFPSPNQRNLAMAPRTIRMKKSRIGAELLDRFAGRIEDLVQKDLIIDDKDYLSLTDLGKLWIDNISYELMYDHIRANFGNAIFSFPQNASSGPQGRMREQDAAGLGVV